MERADEATKGPPGMRTIGERILWRATKAAVKAGYPVKSVNLTHLRGDDRKLEERCSRLQAEMLMWLSGRNNRTPQYNGTIGSMLAIYQTHEESTYRKLKRSSRVPYDIYIRMMTQTIGARAIASCSGPDVSRWFREWQGPEKRLAKAGMAISVLKAALSFGIQLRLKDCAEFKAILTEMRFENPKPRSEAPTAEQITAARASAHKQGHPGAALAYALQFEGAIRQWDVVGQWFELSDPQPSALIDRGQKWIGPTWAHVDEHLILRFTASKTEYTTGAKIVIDLRACPMVLEELERIPAKLRKGPLVLNRKTGLPYRATVFREVWDQARRDTGMPATMWNRDIRAGAITEYRQGSNETDDMAKVAGHASKKTTAKIYDRAHLEAHRRTAEIRKKQRAK